MNQFQSCVLVLVALVSGVCGTGAGITSGFYSAADDRQANIADKEVQGITAGNSDESNTRHGIETPQVVYPPDVHQSPNAIQAAPGDVIFGITSGNEGSVQPIDYSANGGRFDLPTNYYGAVGGQQFGGNFGQLAPIPVQYSNAFTYQSPPQQAFSQQAFPQQAFPQQAFPQQAFPQQAFPQQAFPQHTFFQQTFPQQSFPDAPAAVLPGLATLPQLAVPLLYRRDHGNGQSHFSYVGGPNSRSELRDDSGKVRGSFNYIDAYGKVQSRQYFADENGFRVTGTDIPE